MHVCPKFACLFWSLANRKEDACVLCHTIPYLYYLNLYICYLRYTKKLTSDVVRWKQNFVTLLEACVGGIQLDPTHAFLFCDYGMRKVSVGACAGVQTVDRFECSLVRKF